MSRQGDWMQTYSGKMFWPLSPQVEDVDIYDIAHALGVMCRFGGHCLRFYSVAQHSVLVAGEVQRQTNSDRKLTLTALLHDAAEAYMADIIRPIKRFIPQIKGIESELDRVIAEKFGLVYPLPEVVKEADNVLLHSERRDLMLLTSNVWVNTPAKLLTENIHPWECQEAERMFMQFFLDLND